MGEKLLVGREERGRKRRRQGHMWIIGASCKEKYLTQLYSERKGNTNKSLTSNERPHRRLPFSESVKDHVNLGEPPNLW